MNARATFEHRNPALIGVAAMVAGLIAIGTLSLVALLFQRDGAPLARQAAAERACGERRYVSERDACMRERLGVAPAAAAATGTARSAAQAGRVGQVRPAAAAPVAAADRRLPERDVVVSFAAFVGSDFVPADPGLPKEDGRAGSPLATCEATNRARVGQTGRSPCRIRPRERRRRRLRAPGAADA